ncbi:MAG: Rrf2 family transcriptional regulator [Phycisphaeraceae bacterium]
MAQGSESDTWWRDSASEKSRYGVLKALGLACTRQVQRNVQVLREAAAFIRGSDQGLAEPPMCALQRRIVNAWYAMLAASDYELLEDRFHDMGRRDARRIVLLGALTYDADFDGQELELAWSWGYADDTAPEPCGRRGAAKVLQAVEGLEKLLVEYLSVALEILEHSDGLLEASELQGGKQPDPADWVNETETSENSTLPGPDADRAQIELPGPGTNAAIALQVLLESGAVAAEHRVTTAVLARKAKNLEGNDFKKVVARLRKVGLVETRKGAGGGIWLTRQGEEAARRLRKT